MRVLITGATGFIGAALSAALRGAGHEVVRAARAPAAGVTAVGDIGPDTEWRAALAGVDAVAHLAALAHSRAAERAYQRVNVAGTARLARQAAEAGVSRFVFVSSVLAARDASTAPLRESDAAAPMTAYGRSKRAAEEIVLAEPALRPLVLRPPLVLGPGAKANAALMLRFAASGAPAPLGQLAARRNFIALSSLLAALQAALAAPDGGGGVFFVADQPSLTMAQALGALRMGLNLPARVFSAPVPVPRVLRTTLEVDDSAFRAAYGYGAVGGRDASAALADAARAWKATRR